MHRAQSFADSKKPAIRPPFVVALLLVGRICWILTKFSPRSRSLVTSVCRTKGARPPITPRRFVRVRCLLRAESCWFRWITRSRSGSLSFAIARERIRPRPVVSSLPVFPRARFCSASRVLPRLRKRPGRRQRHRRARRRRRHRWMMQRQHRRGLPQLSPRPQPSFGPPRLRQLRLR